MADAGGRPDRFEKVGQAGPRDAATRRTVRTSGKVIGGRSGGGALLATGDDMQADGKTRKETPVPVAVVRVEGHVDRAAIEACDYYIAGASDGTAGAVVDLSLATAFDREAAVVLVARRRVLKSRGRELVVAAGVSQVRNAIRAHTGAEVHVFTTPEEALAYVRGEGPSIGAPVAGARRRSR